MSNENLTPLKKFSTEAAQMLESINNGKVDLNQLKKFLSRISLLSEPTARQLKRIERIARADAEMK